MVVNSKSLETLTAVRKVSALLYVMYGIYDEGTINLVVAAMFACGPKRGTCEVPDTGAQIQALISASRLSQILARALSIAAQPYFPTAASPTYSSSAVFSLIKLSPGEARRLRRRMAKNTPRLSKVPPKPRPRPTTRPIDAFIDRRPLRGTIRTSWLKMMSALSMLPLSCLTANTKAVPGSVNGHARLEWASNYHSHWTN